MSDTGTTVRNEVQISSAGSNGSGASTPVQAAPAVPSMLPISEASRNTGRPLQQPRAAGQKEPMTMESLQSVRTRKQAVGRFATPTGVVVAERPSATNQSSSQLQVQLQLKAQQIEIAHLKKVLEKVSDKSTKPEALPGQPTQQRITMDRVEKMEKSNRTLSEKTKRLEAMALKRDEDKKAVDTMLLETIPDIKRNIDSLNTWKKTQEARSKCMVLRQEEMTTLQGEIANIDSQLTKRVDEQQKTLGSLSSGLNMTLELRNDVKKRDIFHKLDALSEKVTDIEQNETHTYEKTSSIGRDLNQLRVELDKYIGPFKEEHRSTGVTIVEQLRSITLEQTKLPLPRVTEQTNNFKDDAAQLSSEHKKLQTSQKALSDDMVALKSKIEEVEKGAKETTQKHIQLTKDMESLHLSKLNINSADTLAPMLTNGSEGARLEQIQAEMAEMAQNIATLGGDLEATELTTHEHADSIRSLQEDVPALFKEKLDPFKQAVEQRLETLDRKLGVHSGEVERLSGLAKAQQAQLVTATRDLHDLKEGNKRLQSTMATQDAAVLEVTQQLGLKADVITTDNKMDVIRAALRVLQDQYNNITTDELHQRMVHWFVSTYPTAQNLLQDISSLQQDVERIKPLQSGTQLRVTHTSIDARTALAKNEELGSKLDQQGKQIEKFQSAISKTEALRLGQEEQAKQIESVQAALSGLQSSMHSLNTNSPFAKAEAINALEQAVNDLGVRVDHVAFSQGALGQLRGDIDTLKKKYIEPNKDLFDSYSCILVSVAQLQFIVEAMNKKLPGALEFTFKYDLNALALPQPQVEEQETQNGSGSSKEKSK